MSVLIKPIVTEKSMKDAAQNRYTFAVTKEANRAQIGEEIKRVFGFQPVAVRMITIQNQKKAVVKLKSGEKIDLFDVTENAQKV